MQLIYGNMQPAFLSLVATFKAGPLWLKQPTIKTKDKNLVWNRYTLFD